MKKLIFLASLLCLGCNNDSLPQAPASPSAQSEATFVEGTVAERIDVEGYTYLRLATAKGDTWTAVPTDPVKVGAVVKIGNPMPMEHFHSKSLNRTFDLILFGSIVRPSDAPIPEEKSPVVAKASGADARTVAEVYRDKASLKDKTVSVHGRVVKVSSGILDHNWIHLRDGSGSAAAHDHDLVVTTTQDAKVGEELTIQGTVHTDKDLGSGYRFEVLVEDAKITRP